MPDTNGLQLSSTNSKRRWHIICLASPSSDRFASEQVGKQRLPQNDATGRIQLSSPTPAHLRRRKAIRQRRRKAAKACRLQRVTRDSSWDSTRSLTMISSQHVYEIRPRKDRLGFELIGDRLPLGLLWFEGPDAIVDAVKYAKFCSHSHPAIIRVFDEAGAVVGTIESVGDFRERKF